MKTDNMRVGDKSGKVWLVGAGPGDVGLLTIKGQALLREADVIVYDHLVGRDILALAGRDKTMIDVGKTAGHHPIPQEQINRILVEEAEKGQRVVRLKGGDPFLFGRGGEELEELALHQIPFEVVPGVTSPLAVPAYNGIPVTHRDYASSLHIITGHKKNQADEVNYRALVESGGTLVFLMGVTGLGNIMQQLLEAGMDQQMPAAVLQEGTTARQRKVVSTVSDLAGAAQKAGIEPPAIIVVGEVCGLSEQLSWYEYLPLAGMRVLLTRPAELISATAKRLRRRGAEVLEVPAIDTVPIQENQRLEECLQQIEDYQWLVFTSQVGVRIFFEELEKRKIDIRHLYHVRFAVIGSGTQKALEAQGIFADLMPEVYDGESLAELLAQQRIQGARILIPRASNGNRQLVPVLERAGAVVDDVPIYHTVYQECCCAYIKEELMRDRIDCVVFTSSSTVEGFAAMTEGMDYSKITAACIGRQTAETAGRYGMQCRIADRAAIDDLIELVERIKKEHGEETQEIKKQRSIEKDGQRDADR